MKVYSKMKNALLNVKVDFFFKAQNVQLAIKIVRFAVINKFVYNVKQIGFYKGKFVNLHAAPDIIQMLNKFVKTAAIIVIFALLQALV